MRILLVANEAKEHVNKFHIPTIKMFTEARHTVNVACKIDEDIPYAEVKYNLPISRSPFHSHWFKAYHQLKGIIDDGKYDVIYCHTSVGATLARLAAKTARKNGTKVIKFAHGTYFYRNAPLYNWLYYPLYKYLSWFTDSIITITEEDYLFSCKHFSSAKIFKVNGIGIDLSRFNKLIPTDNRTNLRERFGIPKNDIVLIYCAELIKNKNQSLLLNALKIALKSVKNLSLVLVGIDHYNGLYQKYAKDLYLSDKCFFLGWRKDIQELYNMADICVASSIREGFGLNIVEAMYCGLPVIASDNSGHRSIIKDGENGFLVGVKDEDLFAKRIVELAENPSLRRRLVETAKIDLEKYSSAEVLKSIKQIIEDCK